MPAAREGLYRSGAIARTTPNANCSDSGRVSADGEPGRRSDDGDDDVNDDDGGGGGAHLERANLP